MKLTILNCLDIKIREPEGRTAHLRWDREEGEGEFFSLNDFAAILEKRNLKYEHSCSYGENVYVTFDSHETLLTFYKIFVK